MASSICKLTFYINTQLIVLADTAAGRNHGRHADYLREGIMNRYLNI
jgi:hypothetical protein